jgi:hypothetical protein
MDSAQRWEYCHVEDDGMITYFGVEGYHAEHVPESDDDDYTARSKRIAWLGTQGWELVTIVEYLNEDAFPVTMYFLKRPLADAAVENGHATVAEEPAGEAIDDLTVIAVSDVPDS